MMLDRQILVDRVGVLSSDISSFSSHLNWLSLSPRVQMVATEVAAVCLVDLLQSEVNEALVNYLQAFGSMPQATIIHRNVVSGLRPTVAATFAALANGTAARLMVEKLSSSSDKVRELACAVVPAALAMAELVDARVEVFLTGVVAGLESSMRVASVLGEEHLRRGWDIVGTAGHIGASLGASRVAGLDPKETKAALGYASTEAAGFRQPRGKLSALIAGKASADGIESVRIAQFGLAAPAAPLEGRRGLLALESRGADPVLITLALGEKWLMLDERNKMTHDEDIKVVSVVQALRFGQAEAVSSFLNSLATLI